MITFMIMAPRRPHQTLLVDLPFDVIETIVKALTTDDEPNIDDLSALSQTCKMMLPLARKHLFSSIILRDEGHSDGLYKLISDNPTIILYARKLQFLIPAVDNINNDDMRIIEALATRSSGCFRCMVLTSRSGQALDWKLFPDPLRVALETLLRIHTLKELSLYGISNFPSTLFSTFSGLGSLTIGDNTTFEPPELGSNIVQNKVPAPWSLSVDEQAFANSVAILISGGCIDHSNLVDFSFAIRTSCGIRTTIATFLEDVTQLKDLELVIGHAFVGVGMLVGLGAGIMTQAHKTLTTFIVSAMIEGAETGDSPLLGLNSELGIIKGRNVLETIDISVAAYWNFSTLRNTSCPDWGDLDVLLTTPGAFPALKYVSIELELFYYDAEDLEDDDFDHLSEIHFPRLVAQEGVEFIVKETYTENS